MFVYIRCSSTRQYTLSHSPISNSEAQSMLRPGGVTFWGLRYVYFYRQGPPPHPHPPPAVLPTPVTLFVGRRETYPLIFSEVDTVMHLILSSILNTQSTPFFTFRGISPLFTVVAHRVFLPIDLSLGRPDLRRR